MTDENEHPNNEHQDEHVEDHPVEKEEKPEKEPRMVYQIPEGLTEPDRELPMVPAKD